MPAPISPQSLKLRLGLENHHRPFWLLGIATLLSFGLAAGPIVLSELAGFQPIVGWLLALLFAGVAFAANARIALLMRHSTIVKIVLMTAVSAAGLIVFLLGTTIYFAVRKGTTHPLPVEEQVGNSDKTDALRTPEPETYRKPPTHLEIAYRDGMTRLDDGAAAVVTAIALTPKNDAIVVGHADGTTRIWPLDQPAFEPPRAGPRGDGAVRRIEFDTSGTFVFLTCDRGLAVAMLSGNRVSTLIRGDPVAVTPVAKNERFAAIRGGKLVVRYVPLELARNPPSGRTLNGTVITAPKDETLPLGVRADLIATKPTFLAWHPSGKLIGGVADGTISSWAITGPATAVVSKDHKSPVRAWTAGPPDFATGDDAGFVGYWPNKSIKPTLFKASDAPIRQLGFSACGGELAVADSKGTLSMWNLAARTKSIATKRKEPIAAVAYGPEDDIILLANGKAVEMWWIPELIEKSTSP